VISGQSFCRSRSRRRKFVRNKETLDIPCEDWAFVVDVGMGFKLRAGGTRRLRVLAAEELLVDADMLE